MFIRIDNVYVYIYILLYTQKKNGVVQLHSPLTQTSSEWLGKSVCPCVCVCVCANICVYMYIFYAYIVIYIYIRTYVCILYIHIYIYNARITSTTILIGATSRTYAVNPAHPRLQQSGPHHGIGVGHLPTEVALQPVAYDTIMMYLTI